MHELSQRQVGDELGDLSVDDDLSVGDNISVDDDLSVDDLSVDDLSVDDDLCVDDNRFVRGMQISNSLCTSVVFLHHT